MNYVAANYISRTELLLCAERYPKTARKIRKFAIYLALARKVIAVARTVREQRALATGSGKELSACKASSMLFATISGAAAPTGAGRTCCVNVRTTRVIRVVDD